MKAKLLPTIGLVGLLGLGCATSQNSISQNSNNPQLETLLFKPSVLKNLYWDTIIIDPGHGGEDPGAMYGNLFEKDYTFGIATILKEILDAKGCKTFITRTSDRTLDSGSRVAYANKIAKNPRYKNLLFVSLHVNSTKGTGYSDKMRGPFFVYNTLYSPEELCRLKQIGDPILQKIKRIGLSPCAEFTYLPDKHSKNGRIEIIREIDLQDVLFLELGNIRNARDRKILSYKTSLANAIADGLAENRSCF